LRALNVEPSLYYESLRGLIAEVAQVDYVEVDDHAALVSKLRSAPYEALFVRIGAAVNREVLDAAPKLRFVITPTTGLDHIDVALAESRGIRVLSLRGETAFLENVHSTAEHTWALLLGLIRRLPAAHSDVLAGRWRRQPFVGSELHGKTLGVIGCGRLGRKIVGFGAAFGMDVLAFDEDAAAIARTTARAVGIDELLAASSIVSLHLSLTPETHRFVSRERIARMRPGTIFINTARGEIVDEAALLDALKSGHLAGAALDVVDGDASWTEAHPLEAHPLVAYARANPNLLLTPHIGGYARESIDRTRRFVAERFIALARS